MTTAIPTGKDAPLDPEHVYSIVIYGNSTSADTKAISTSLARYHARPSSLAAVATANQPNPDLRAKILKYRLTCIDNLSTEDSSLDVELSAEQMDDLTENGAGQGAVIYTNAKVVVLGSKTGNIRTRLNITGTSVFQLERPAFPADRFISLTNILAGNFNVSSHLTFVGHVLAVRDYVIADARNDLDKYRAVAYITNTALATEGHCILLVSKWPLLGGQDNISKSNHPTTTTYASAPLRPPTASPSPPSTPTSPSSSLPLSLPRSPSPRTTSRPSPRTMSSQPSSSRPAMRCGLAT